MVDLSPTTLAKSDILNADDLIGKPPMTVKITKVSSVSGEQPISINFEGDNDKPFMPCKSMRRLLVFIWGKDGKNYVGKRMTLYRDPEVKFGGLKVGGVRISHMSDIDEERTVALTASKGKKAGYTVRPLAADKPPKPADPAVVLAGDAAAMRGVAEYTKWLATLAPDVKASVRGHHTNWSAVALKSDVDEATAKEGGA